MTDGERYDQLVADWQAKFSALNAFPLFKAGVMQNNRLAEFEGLREAEREARQHKDDLIAALRAR